MSEPARRPLTDNERTVLAKILSATFPGVDELRAQLASAQTDAPADAPGFDIQVPATMARSSVSSNPIPVEAQVLDENKEYLGELLVWVTDGRLSSLEYAWITDEPPTKLPGAQSVLIQPNL